MMCPLCGSKDLAESESTWQKCRNCDCSWNEAMRPVSAPTTGLYRKFKVERLAPPSEGKDHTACEYFVLDPQHDTSAFRALQVYAEDLRWQDNNLALDIQDWLDRITR